MCKISLYIFGKRHIKSEFWRDVKMMAVKIIAAYIRSKIGHKRHKNKLWTDLIWIFLFDSFLPWMLNSQRFNTVEQLWVLKWNSNCFSWIIIIKQTDRSRCRGRQRANSKYSQVILFALILAVGWLDGWMVYTNLPLFCVVSHNFPQWFIHRDQYNPVKNWRHTYPCKKSQFVQWLL